MTDRPLSPALSAERRTIDGAGGLSYYVAGTGAPLLLIHSVNAAGSAYEVKPIFDTMVGQHRVYALDLPGFGFSDRSARRYDRALYIAAIEAMMVAIAQETRTPSFDVLALSLACEFAAHRAVAAPQLFRTLALVNPTGFMKIDSDKGDAAATREVPLLGGVLDHLPGRRRVFNLLVSRPSIRFFLKKTFGSKHIDEGLMAYDYETAHQPGAEHAPYAFISGRLFSRYILGVYERLRVPVWLPHGTKGDFADFSQAHRVAAWPNWTIEAYPTGALPHFEQPAKFAAAYESFLSSAVSSDPSPPRSPSP